MNHPFSLKCKKFKPANEHLGDRGNIYLYFLMCISKLTGRIYAWQLCLPVGRSRELGGRAEKTTSNCTAFHTFLIFEPCNCIIDSKQFNLKILATGQWFANLYFGLYRLHSLLSWIYNSSEGRYSLDSLLLLDTKKKEETRRGLEWGEERRKAAQGRTWGPAHLGHQEVGSDHI